MTSGRAPAFLQVPVSDSDAPATASAAFIVASEPAILADCIAEWLEVSDERDHYDHRIIAAEIRGYQRGRADGDEAGYLRATAEFKSVQQDLYRCWRELSELERRRWGPGGRRHFADPRPGDYPGNGAA